MFNRLTLDTDTLQNYTKRRDLRRKLAKQMILDTNYLKVERVLLRFFFFCILIYTISHYMAHGYLFFLYPLAMHG